MAYEKSEGVVLRKVDYSETSQIVTFLTVERGKMACLARGSRRKASPYGATLDTFNRVEIIYTWKDNRQIQTLVDATLLEPYTHLKIDIRRNAFAAFLLEAILLTTCENTQTRELFDMLTNGLALLTDSGVLPEVVTARSILHILRSAGIMPNFEKPSNLPFYLSGTHFACIRQAFHQLLVDPVNVTPPTVELIFEFLHNYLAYHFETSFKSYSVLKTLIKESLEQ